MTAGVVMEKMSAEERYTFWAGIIEGLAHARYVNDNKDTAGRACIYGWFYDEPRSRDKIREASLKYPDALTGQIIGALVATKCGAQMTLIAPSPWRLEFARKAAMAHEPEKRLRDERLAKDKREKEEREAGAEEQADMLALVDLVLASEQQIDVFTVKLDAWDAATVEALMQNEEELLAVRERIASMLLDAHVLPDGRRVFKTRDGTQVFDEFGVAVPPEEIAPDEIANDKPRWETFFADRRNESVLEQERDELLSFQEKLDDARERIDDSALTEDDLSALENELGEAAPERVAAILTRDAQGPAQPAQEHQSVSAPAAEQDARAFLNLHQPAGP